MAADWYSPDHGPVAHLDPVFTHGNAPALAGMLKALGNAPNDQNVPAYYSCSWWEELGGNSEGEYTAQHRFRPGIADDITVCSILQGSMRDTPARDLPIDEFFFAADILSGQQLGKGSTGEGFDNKVNITDGGFGEQAVDAIEDARKETPHWSDLKRRFTLNGTLWDSWNTSAAAEAQKKFEKLENWFGAPLDGGRQDRLLNMSDYMVQFAAAIHGARANLNNLMGDTLAQVEAWNNSAKSGANADGGAAWIVISGVVGMASASGGGAAAVAFVNAVNALVGKVQQTKESTEDPQCYGILTNYLQKAESIVKDAVTTVEQIAGQIDRIEDPPKIPEFTN